MCICYRCIYIHSFIHIKSHSDIFAVIACYSQTSKLGPSMWKNVQASMHSKRKKKEKFYRHFFTLNLVSIINIVIINEKEGL